VKKFCLLPVGNCVCGGYFYKFVNSWIALSSLAHLSLLPQGPTSTFPHNTTPRIIKKKIACRRKITSYF